MKTSLLSLLLFFFFSSFLFSQTFQWEQLSGPHGGAIYSIAKDNHGNIYANTMWGSGPFKSTDNGESWFSIRNGLTPYTGEFHPLNINSNGDLFIGGAHNTAYLCRSMDGGSSWEPLNNLNTNQGSVICISFDVSDNVYVGTGTGIYKSTNNGEDWATLPQFGPVQVDAITFNDSGYIFAGTSYGVYRSTDDGTTWTQLPTGGGTRTVAVAPNGYIFAGCWENAGILRSTDNGDSWTYVYPQTVQIRSASTILFDENNYIYVPTYGNGVLFSTDFGDTWTELNNNLGNKYLRALTKNNNYLFAGSSSGIYKMNVNYAYWYSVGLAVSYVKALSVDTLNGFVFASAVGMSRSGDAGATWETINNGISPRDVVSSEIKSIVIKSDGTIFIGYATNFPSTLVYRSTDSGSNWVLAQSGIQGGEILGLAVDDSGYVYASTDWQGVYKSTNNGDNWFSIGNPSSGGKLSLNSLGDLFLASYGGGMWKLPAGDTVWVSLGGTYIYTFFISRIDYLYTDQARSTDNGLTWETMPLGNMAYSFAENSQGHLFAGTFNYGSGVKRSTDYGVTWESINSGIPTQDVRCVAVDADGYLYAGPWGYSLYKTTTSTITSVETEKNLPSSFYLEQNYPNPFNPSTKIRFTIPASTLNPFSKGEGTLVQLKVYDVLGNEIATLVDEYKPSGTYEVEFRPESPAGACSIKQPASGIYFYQLKAGEFIQTRKMVYLK